MALISIIIPIYNTEDYLEECLDSVLNQSFKDFELILVDDGSLDNCPTICDDYGKKDNRITVIHKKNGGQSSARNAGLDYVFANSNSKYISFIDSDDYVDKNFFLKLYNAIGDCDISICQHFSKYEDKVILEGRNKKPKIITADYYWNLKLGNAGGVFFSNKLISKDLFCDLRFPDVRIMEDECLIYKIVNKSNSISIIPDHLYYYRIHYDSLSRSARHQQIAQLRMVLLKEKFLSCLSDNAGKYFISKTLNNYFFSTSWYLSKGYFDLVKTTLKEVNPIISTIPKNKIILMTKFKKTLWKINIKRYYRLVI